MQCQKCGHHGAKDARYCGSCGSPIGIGASPDSERSGTQAGDQPIVSGPDLSVAIQPKPAHLGVAGAPRGWYRQTRQRRRKGTMGRRPALLLLGVVVLAAALVGAGFVTVNRLSSGRTSQAEKSHGWQLEGYPKGLGLSHGSINAASCPSPSRCYVVGTGLYDGAMAPVLLSYRRGVSKWVSDPLRSSTVSGNSNTTLAGVSCSNASFCVAVGEGNHPVILATTDAGRVWHVETYPSGLGLSRRSRVLTSVSCSSTADCLIVGDPVLLATTTGGRSWREENLPVGARNASLSSVSCAKGSVCVAVGRSSAPVVAATTDASSNIPAVAGVSGTGSIGCPRSASCPAAPAISYVSPITSKQPQTIVIEGIGFGYHSPYNGDGNHLRLHDNTGGWDAGWHHWDQGASCWGGCPDWVTVAVKSWTPTEIILSGATGSYGSLGWTFNPGDAITVSVWNAQATYSKALLTQDAQYLQEVGSSTPTGPVSTPISTLGLFAPTPPVGIVGQPFSYQARVEGPAGTYQWSLDGGSLPAGLSLNSSTGQVDGTPTAATGGGGNEVGLQVVDSTSSGNYSATAALDFVVAQPHMPLVTSISQVALENNPTIVITGINFGDSFPASLIGQATTTPYLAVFGCNGGGSCAPGTADLPTWTAGYKAQGALLGDVCDLTVEHWTNSTIVLKFDSSPVCPFALGDVLGVQVWDTNQPTTNSPSQPGYTTVGGGVWGYCISGNVGAVGNFLHGGWTGCIVTSGSNDVAYLSNGGAGVTPPPSNLKALFEDFGKATCAIACAKGALSAFGSNASSTSNLGWPTVFQTTTAGVSLLGLGGTTMLFNDGTDSTNGFSNGNVVGGIEGFAAGVGLGLPFGVTLGDGTMSWTVQPLRGSQATTVYDALSAFQTAAEIACDLPGSPGWQAACVYAEAPSLGANETTLASAFDSSYGLLKSS